MATVRKFSSKKVIWGVLSEKNVKQNLHHHYVTAY